MKNEKMLKSFESDAKQNLNISLDEKLSAGSTILYKGKPVEIDDGKLSIRQMNGSILIFKKEDVISLKDEKGFYLVEVKEGADLGYRIDSVCNRSSEYPSVLC